MPDKIYGNLISTLPAAYSKRRVKVELIIANLTNPDNAPFDTNTKVQAALTVTTTRLTAFASALTGRNTELRKTTSASLQASMKPLVYEVETLANGDLAKLFPLGFDMAKIPTHATNAPGLPIGVGGRSSAAHSGIAHLFCDPVTGALNYDVRISLLSTGPWTEQTGLTNSQDFKFVGLTRLTDYYGQIRANNTVGKGDYCAPFLFTVY